MAISDNKVDKDFSLIISNLLKKLEENMDKFDEQVKSFNKE